MADRATLGQWLESQTTGTQDGEVLAKGLAAFADGVVRIASLVRQGPLAPGSNPQAPLSTVIKDGANAIALEAAQAAPVAHYASRHTEDVLTLDASAPLAMAINTMNGLENLDVNACCGSIVSVYRRADSPEASFLRPGREQLAAGYSMYGPSTTLVLTLGRGAAVFTLDAQTSTFVLVNPELRTPEDADTFAINAANYRHWESPVRAYIDDCFEGIEGPHYKDFRMRWLGALVPETHRILTQGGIFLCPRDHRPGHETGSLPRMFDAAPIAMLAEQCGGAATDGANRILDTVPRSLHARAPLVFGSRKKVAKVQRYHESPDFIPDQAPLFGVRGLFRS
ncbi:class 1 fructose-bisphosphatase [uncultured Rhodospira sp.]|uniref:class 1 fructose-bisphosphatase n=1 Tax=uncultured Rhodospira sp. TaxID=1936189 RepID=UPI0026271A21|nr:class 1 fructose-bisphosphatase [uncultured Rhodospira sp.]